MNRRRFLSSSAAAAAGALLAPSVLGQSQPTARAQPKIPRWRGFNLTELTRGDRTASFRESDFAWMAEWGFNFARLPLSYWLWSSPGDWLKIDPDLIRPVDRAVELGRQYGIHVNIGFHRIPGYCVNGREKEPYQLFDSPRDSMRRALDAATLHWRTFAERYKALPNSQVSFDLFNEPPWMADQSRYVEVATALIRSIRSVSPDRLIVADGADIGQTPVLGLIDQGIVQSTRGYLPKMVSHYTANWVPPAEFESTETPRWPMRDKNGVLWDREKLRAELITKWKPLTDRGAPVHVGEWGCLNTTPRAACMGWITDLLALWKEAGWGWSMWGLRGHFGIVDSERQGVAYEDFHGHKLDREMLELIRQA